MQRRLNNQWESYDYSMTFKNVCQNIKTHSITYRCMWKGKNFLSVSYRCMQKWKNVDYLVHHSWERKSFKSSWRTHALISPCNLGCGASPSSVPWWTGTLLFDRLPTFFPLPFWCREVSPRVLLMWSFLLVSLSSSFCSCWQASFTQSSGYNLV